MMTQSYCDHFDTPLGKMQITANNCAVTEIHFVDQLRPVNRNELTDLAKFQMLQYFAGKLTRFDMPIDLCGTDFHKRVWQALITVDYGKTASYSDIANKINNRKAVRAVGGANGRNPMTIVVPCHRIIGSKGSLTGYAFGIERKAWLLKHEAGVLYKHKGN